MPFDLLRVLQRQAVVGVGGVEDLDATLEIARRFRPGGSSERSGATIVMLTSR